MKKVAFLCCLFCGLITQAIGAIYNCKQQVVDSRSFGAMNRRNFLIMGESESEDSIVLLCGTAPGWPYRINGCEKGTNVGVEGNFYYGGYALDNVVGLFECDDGWRQIKLGDIEECSSTDGLTLYAIGGKNDEYNIYASFGASVKFGDDPKSHYDIFNELCKVTKKDSASNGDSSTAPTEPTAISDTKEVPVTKCNPDTKNGIKAKKDFDGVCVPTECLTPRWTLSGAGENAKCVEQECKIDNGTGKWTPDDDTWKCTVETCKNGYKHDKENNKCSRDGESDADEDEDADTATTDTSPSNDEDKKTQQNESRPSETDSQAKIDELRDNAEAMRAKEQSTANKLLGAAGIGTTGIGAMQTASAMAEQNADADAERTMRAYLATFHCDYGAGKSVQGGQSNIDLPGGNELIGLYSEYVNLANDLKVRKNALNIRPGIESEPILDAATSGLYDDVAIGTTSGAYTSLARALMDPNGADAAAWAQQKSDTADTKKAGMITAGIGVAGSLAANLAINSGKNKQNKIDEILAEYDRQNTSKDGVNDETIINCIEVIMNNTHFITPQNKIIISCANPDHELTRRQALAISKNWDDKNLQPYSNTDSVVQEHEKDACETLKKLKKYIIDKDLCPELF